jgi:hypothetical protein
MTDTWVFCRGRWKLIADRQLVALVLLGFLIFAEAGFLIGVGLVDVLIRYEMAPVKTRLAEIQREVAAIKAERH